MDSIPTEQQFYAALACDPVRLAMWRKLAAKLYTPDVKPLATSESPDASTITAEETSVTHEAQET